MLISSATYVPILKAQAAEFKALAHLSNEARRTLGVFLDLTKPNLVQGQAVEGYLRKTALRSARAIGPGRPVYVDLFDFEPNIRTHTGAHPLTKCLEYFREFQLSPVPVCGFDRDDQYLQVIRRDLHHYNAGMCIRVIDDDLDLEDPIRLVADLLSLIERVGAEPEQVDVILDLRSLVAKSRAEVRVRLMESVAALQQAANFRSIILAG